MPPLRRQPPPTGCPLDRRRALALLGAFAAWPLHGRANPAWLAEDLDWHDAARNRAVPVRLYLPTAEAAPQQVPLVVFSHGIGGSRLGYRYLGQHFAAHGVASLHLQHVGSDRQVWTGGSLFGVIGRLQSAAQEAEALARVQDLRFALDQLLLGAHGGRIDASRIAAAGHSYGANTVLLAAGARVQRDGRALALAERRIRAAIAISAPPFYGEGDPQAILGAVTLPTLHITTTEDVIRIPGYFSGPEDRLAVYQATGSRAKWLAMFNRGNHSSFVGRGGEASPVVAPTRELALAFLRTVLDGDAAALPDWTQRHAGMLERFEAAAA